MAREGAEAAIQRDQQSQLYYSTYQLKERAETLRLRQRGLEVPIVCQRRGEDCLETMIMTQPAVGYRHGNMRDRIKHGSSDDGRCCLLPRVLHGSVSHLHTGTQAILNLRERLS